MEDDKKLSYFFLGLGIGVAVGLLFAPKSGVETREMLAEKADEGKQFLKRTTEDLKGSATDLFDKGKSAIARQREQLAAAVEAGRNAYREKVDEGSIPAGPDEELIEGV